MHQRRAAGVACYFFFVAHVWFSCLCFARTTQQLDELDAKKRTARGLV